MRHPHAPCCLWPCRIAVGLYLGTPLCLPHICHHCGGHADALATHGLSCIKSQGRFSKHAAINAIIHRSLAAINVPSTLEPIGLCRSDGKRRDGCSIQSIAPWKSGQCLVWDFTCVDTFAASYISDATMEARAVATTAEARKPQLVKLGRRNMLCCPNLTILYQSQLRPQVPLALMLSVCSQISAGVSRALHMTTSPSHSFSKECPLHYSTAMLPLYWAPQVASNLYTCSVTLCHLYVVLIINNV